MSARNDCDAERPAGSLTVTITVALPRATATRVTMLPSTEGADRAASAVVAAKVSMSPSGSLK